MVLFTVRINQCFGRDQGKHVSARQEPEKCATGFGLVGYIWEVSSVGPLDPLIEQARAAFHANAQKIRADRYRIVFKAGWVKIGKPFMVRSQQEEFVVWVEDGGVEDFRLDQIASMELLPHPD